MNLGEVISIQIGHYSNFVGAHWWNLQEASFIYDPSKVGTSQVDHDVMFREGMTKNGQITYTPRLIAFDLKGSLNSLKEEGSLYNTEHSDSQDELAPWPGPTEKYCAEPALKNEFLRDLEQEENEAFNSTKREDEMNYNKDSANDASKANENETQYNLDSEISVWSDFLRTHWHPKSLCIVSQYMHNATFAPFDTFSYGLDIYEKIATEYEDKLHFFIEECDHLQGFHLLTDVFDGFGGIAYKIIEDIRNEFRSKAILNINPFPITNTSAGPLTDLKLINTVLSLSYCNEYCNATLPISLNTSSTMDCIQPVKFSYLNYDPLSMYHSSGIIAASLDTATLPYRSLSGYFTADHLYDTLTEAGRKILSLSTGFPLPICDDATLTTFLESVNGNMDSVLTCISPGHKERNSKFSRYVTLRGMTASPTTLEANKSTSFEGLQHKYSKSVRTLQQFLSKSYPNSLSLCSIINDTCNVSAPFPSIFSKYIPLYGDVKARDENNQKMIDTRNITTMTSLESSSGSQSYLKSLLNQAKNISIRRYHQFKENGMEEDTYLEALNNLSNLAETYCEIDYDL